jgi:type VI secretion system protein ImpK
MALVAAGDARDGEGGRGRRGLLALALQEALTAVARVRANRQAITDATSFRNHIKQLLNAGHEEARRAGYESEDVKLAIYALVVFLDESILNSPNPALAGWSRKPLQEELFGEHMGGQVLFENLRALLARQDSEELGDVLEVYQLCLLLGFQGQYAAAGQSEVPRWAGAAAEKMARIRGGTPGLAPGWVPPERESFPVLRDPWIRSVGFTALGLSFTAILTWVILKVTLGSWVANLQSLKLGR